MAYRVTIATTVTRTAQIVRLVGSSGSDPIGSRIDNAAAMPPMSPPVWISFETAISHHSRNTQL